MLEREGDSDPFYVGDDMRYSRAKSRWDDLELDLEDDKPEDSTRARELREQDQQEVEWLVAEYGGEMGFTLDDVDVEDLDALRTLADEIEDERRFRKDVGIKSADTRKQENA